jgi:hypothetical protein
MDKTESTVRNILTAVEAPLCDIGVLSDRGMLPGCQAALNSRNHARLFSIFFRDLTASSLH